MSSFDGEIPSYDFDADAKAIASRKADEIEREADLRYVMAHERGRRFVYAHLEWCGMFRSSFAEGTREDTDFREGTRNSALRLFAELRQTLPELTKRMLEENL